MALVVGNRVRKAIRAEVIQLRSVEKGTAALGLQRAVNRRSDDRHLVQVPCAVGVAIGPVTIVGDHVDRYWHVFVIEQCVIDRDRHTVTRGDDKLRLTPKEFELLLFLAQRPGRVLTHRAILTAIWGPHAVDQPEHLRVLLGALRKKLEPDPSRPRYIVTEPWVGYRFTEPESRPADESR